MLKIEVVTAPGCVKCGAAKDLIKRIIKKYRCVDLKEIDVVEHPEIAVKHGIFSTPAILLNGKLEFRGLPSENELAKKIEGYIKKK